MRKEKGLYCEINLQHKIIQKINLKRILNEKSVKDKIPNGHTFFL